MDFIVRKGLDQNLSFPLPIDPCGGICDDIFLGVGKLEKSPKTFQNAIDIARGKIFANQILDILFDVRRANCLQLCQLFVLFQIVKEQCGVVIVAFCGSWTEPSQVTFHLKFFQTVSC